MSKMLLTVLFVLFAGVASAQDATVSYNDAIRQCGAEWRGRDDKATNKGRDAWNTFRAECVKRQGYVSKSKSGKEKLAPIPQSQWKQAQ